MQKSWLHSFIIGLFSSLSAGAITLSPGTPIPITMSGDIDTTVVVSGTSAGFLLTCTNGPNDLVSSFSSDGKSWSSPATLYLGTYTPSWVTGNSSGFLTTFITPSIGFSVATAASMFSTTDGAMWSSQSQISATATVAPYVVSAGTSAGFMATWLDTADYNAYASFSSDGLTWSMMPVQITTSGLLSTSPFYTVSVCGTTSGFLAAWLQTDGNPYASFSSGTSNSWSPMPIQIASVGNVASDVWVAANSSGVMAVWIDTSGNGYSSFSVDNGSSWSLTPSLIATGLLSGSDLIISGASSGFVAAWIGSDNNGYASVSTDQGTTWSAPVAITTGGTVSTSYVDSIRPFVFPCAFGTHCVFAWQDSSSNAYVSYSPFGSATPRAFNRPCNQR